MIAYAASDLHGNLPPVPDDAELVFLAGDICPDFRPHGRHNHWSLVDESGIAQWEWCKRKLSPWLDALESRGVMVVATPGNHDFVFESTLYRGLARRELLWSLLIDEEVEFDGVRIYGTPWVPGLPYWAFYGDDRRLKLRADAIPDGLDVLMTHGPPLMLGDYIPTSERQRNKYGNYGGEHVGDPTLNEALARARPSLVLTGHIHEARGQYLSDQNVPVYNIAAVDALYDLHKVPFRRFVIHEQ